MSDSADTQAPKRRYDNSRRRQQAEQTRNAILDALARQLADNNSTDFSVDEAAREAGVTTRTVFRHFPTKEKMLEGVSEWVLGITGRVEIPQSPAQFARTAQTSYAMFEEHAGLMRALLLSELGRGVRTRLSPRRRKGLSDALEPAVAGLPPNETKAVKALLIHLLSAETWWQLHDAFGVKGEDSARVTGWTIDLVLEALRSGNHPASRSTEPA